MEGCGLVIRDGDISRGVGVAVLLQGDGVGADGDPVEGCVGDFAGISAVDEDRSALGRRGHGEAPGQGGQFEVDLCGLAGGDRDRHRGVGVAVEFHGDDMVAGRDVREGAVGDFPGLLTVEPDRGAGRRRGDEDAAGFGGILDYQEGCGSLHVVGAALERRDVLAGEERGHIALVDADLARSRVVPGVRPGLVIKDQFTLVRPGAGGDGDQAGACGVRGVEGERRIRRRLFGGGALACAAVEEVEALVHQHRMRGGDAVVIDDREEHPADRDVPAAGEGVCEDGGVALRAEGVGDVVDGHAVGIRGAPSLLVFVESGLLDRCAVKGQGDVLREDRALVVGVGDVEPGAGDRGAFGDCEIAGGPVDGVVGPVGAGGEVGAVTGRPEEVAANVVGFRGGDVFAVGPALAAVAVVDDGLLDAEQVVLFVRFADETVGIGDGGDRHGIAGVADGLVGPGDGGVCARGEAVDRDRAGCATGVEFDRERAGIGGADVRDLRGVDVLGCGEDFTVVRSEGADREIGGVPAGGRVFYGKCCKRGLVRSTVRYVRETAVVAGGQVVLDVPVVRSKVTRWGPTRIGSAVERVQGVFGREHDVLEGSIRPAGGKSAGGKG
ncbi:hypothetical protein DSECCO2_318150 [anaerobic digester metagenome]